MPTGLVMAPEEFGRRATPVRNVMRCPACGQAHEWRMEEAELEPERPEFCTAEGQKAPDEREGLAFLVVDDFSTTRRIIKSLLNDLGYHQVAEADDGTTALPLLRNRSFDFLIADWNMPGMAGLELLRHVRRDPRLAKLPVLMLAADAKRDQILEAAQAGVDGYMVKPFTADTLKEKIDRILASHAA